MAPVVVGVDPGGRYTGVVARTGSDDVAQAVLLTRSDGDGIDEWCRFVVRGVLDVVMATEAPAVAVEQARAPRGHASGRGGHIINPGPIIDTAHVVGALVGAMAGTETAVDLVEPGGHGSLPLWVYPAVLVGAREGDAGTGKRRHVRSAWDVAGASRWRTTAA